MAGKRIAVLALLAGTALVAELAAAPLQLELPSSSVPVIPAGGCHGDVRTHYVPEVTGELPHYHTGGNCRPIAAQGQPGAIQQDCHRDVQRHQVPGVGQVYHSHSRRSCRVVLAEQPQAQDCHDDVRLHFVPGQGEIYHAHRGQTCQAVEYEPSQGPSRPGCMQIGPVQVCP
jgi:hypothetical protein